MTYQNDIRAIRDSQAQEQARLNGILSRCGLDGIPVPSAAAPSTSHPVSVDLSALREAMAAEKAAMEAILAKCRSWQQSEADFLETLGEE